MRERVGARKRVVDRELTRVRVKWIRLSDRESERDYVAQWVHNVRIH